MKIEVNSNQNMRLRIYNILKNVVDFAILLLEFMLEIFLSTIKLFTWEELKDVSGETVLITGAGHGIGRELALQYTELGCQVICVDINEINNEETAKQAKSMNKGPIYSYTCDVSNRDNIMKLAKKIFTEIGDVSVLINNVGIMPTHPIEKHSSNEIQKLFDINVLSQFWTLEAFLPQMKVKNRGHIVAISSIAGIVGLSNLVPYCATKFAIRGLMEGLYEELRESGVHNMIRTTTIYPYMVNTGLCKKPKVKFPTILGLLEPKNVAQSIIKAQRTNMKEATVPRALFYINNASRFCPLNCALLLKDFIGSGVESDI